MSTVKRRINIGGQSMAYIDIGSGDPIVFLHGNPASSYLWRNIIPYVQDFGRVIAPDLIGMGDSEKLPRSDANSYTFDEHRKYLDGLFEALDLTRNVTLVVHDWGSSLGFDWARRHPQAVRGIAHMEGLIAPLEWEEMPEAARPRFQAVRSPQGEELVLQQNIFIEQSLVKGTFRQFSVEELTEYRRPFLEPGEGRRPMLTWPRQIPIGGEPENVAKVFDEYGEWLAKSPVPKLYFRAEPGTHSPRLVSMIRGWPNQKEVAVKGIHYPQEDDPHVIGVALAGWLQDLPRV